jgi:4-hydroxy-tetrahydrodipicolinate reductase
LNISVIGSGKTGGKVVELLGDEGHHVFDEEHPVDAALLSDSDAVIIFVPGQAVPDILEEVLKSRVPAIWGSTGFEWTEELHQQVKEQHCRWLTASNFSIGMNLIRKMIEVLSRSSGILPDPEFSIHEVHHIHKLDAPSGTALSWKEWLDEEADITHEREGDVKGIHQLEVETDFEKITLRHEALDRAVFASGAIWATKQFIKQKEWMGIHTFSELFDQIYKELMDG